MSESRRPRRPTRSSAAAVTTPSNSQDLDKQEEEEDAALPVDEEELESGSGAGSDEGEDDDGGSDDGGSDEMEGEGEESEQEGAGTAAASEVSSVRKQKGSRQSRRKWFSMEYQQLPCKHYNSAFVTLHCCKTPQTSRPLVHAVTAGCWSQSRLQLQNAGCLM